MKSTVISVITAIALIGGAFMLTSIGEEDVVNANNVVVVEGKQIIEIKAKGGYQPRKSIAKSGIPTTIRFNTNGTFDCSSSVRIPSMDISKILPQSGTIDVDIGVQQAGVLKGSCSMGMYPFEIEFQG